MQADISSSFILIDTARQTLEFVAEGRVVASFPVSTSPRGLGSEAGSLRTPGGRFLVAEKVGHGLPEDTVFKSRLPLERQERASLPDDDLVVGRILRLHGLDPDNSNTLDRFIYIHGTNHPELVGRPAGNGCVRMRPQDAVALFEMVSVGTIVRVQ